MPSFTIAFCYNVKRRDVSAMSPELDFDSLETIDAIVKTVENLGYPVIRIEADKDAYVNLALFKNKIDLVFNIAEGMRGDARESNIPQYCEALEIPYTHSSPTVLAICLDKYLTRLAVRGAGIRVPEAVLVQDGKIGDWDKLTAPVIIKPNSEGSSMGIFNANVVNSLYDAEKRMKELRAEGLKGEILVEEYIEGREFTVGLLDNPPQVLPIIEQKFDFLPEGMQHVAGYELKWMIEDKLEKLTDAYDCPPKITPEQKRLIEETSVLAFNTLKIRDCARIDFRMDRRGKLYFLEINPLPGINPDEKQISYFPLAARMAGIKFPELVQKIITSARARWGV